MAMINRHTININKNLWCNLVSNLSNKSKGYSLNNGDHTFIRASTLRPRGRVDQDGHGHRKLSSLLKLVCFRPCRKFLVNYVKYLIDIKGASWLLPELFCIKMHYKIYFLLRSCLITRCIKNVISCLITYNSSKYLDLIPTPLNM